MPTDPLQDEVMARYLGSEISSLNSQLPKSRKTLTRLMREEHPCVCCLDGSEHSFKPGELRYLASILQESEQDHLLLPMIIEVHSGRSEMLVRSRDGVEAKVLSKILDMPLAPGKAGVRIYQPQLGALRRMLKTATQYVFTS